MASRTARKEWIRGLPSAIGEGRYERKLVHSASERSVGYVFLTEESVQKHLNPHPYQTGSKQTRMLTVPADDRRPLLPLAERAKQRALEQPQG